MEIVDDGSENARLAGQEAERNRIFKLFHDHVAYHLLAAMFEMELLKQELESQGLQESKAFKRITERIAKAVYGLESILDPEESDARGEGTTPRSSW